MSSDCTNGTAAAGCNLKEAGDFIERVKGMGATAVVVGSVSVRFGEPPVADRKPRPPMTAREIQEYSA